MADKSMIGMDLGKGSIEVEKGRLRFFAKATGETNPVYIDEAAARDAGHRSLPVPPTFFMCLNSDVSAASGIDRMKVLQVDLGRILHAEQAFDYHRIGLRRRHAALRHDGQRRLRQEGGALHLVVNTTRVTNQDGEHVADMRSTLVERRG